MRTEVSAFHVSQDLASKSVMLGECCQQWACLEDFWGRRRLCLGGFSISAHVRWDRGTLRGFNAQGAKKCTTR